MSVDVGVQLEGLHADSAATMPVGKIDPDTERLLRVTQECLVPVSRGAGGTHVGDTGTRFSGGGGCRVRGSPGAGGHGIGTRFHEESPDPQLWSPQARPPSARGMTLAIGR